MEIRIPDLGDFDAVEVIEVLVKPGDRVAVDDPLVTLETEKAAMDVPSAAAGEIKELKIQVGDRVSKGDVVAVLEEEHAATAAESAGPTAAGDRNAPTRTEPEQSAAQEPATAERPDGGSEGAPRREPVTVPDLGDFEAVDVIEVLVAEGDEVAAEQGLITLETEKAAMDVPAPKAGRVVALHVAPGDKVSAGDRVAELETAAADTEPPARQAAGEGGRKAARTEPAARAVQTPPPADAEARAPAAERRPAAGARLPAVDEAGFAKAHASPSVRKLARELGVNLAAVPGSGRKARVTADDVKQWVKEFIASGGRGEGAALPAVPQVDFSRFGGIKREPLSRIQKIAAPRLHASWVNLPHVTQHDEADITRLEEVRQGLKGRAEERGVKLTPLAFILRACVLALQEFPRFNASLDADGEHLVLKQYLHMGFAADTPQGLVVPVIRDADRQDVFELAQSLAEQSKKARDGNLKSADIQGGCFTVSSLGGIGGTAFTPIINAPEVAILGVSRARMQPVWDADAAEFKPRLMLPLSLSYDHRVIDGADAARFTSYLCGVLSQVEKLMGAVP